MKSKDTSFIKRDTMPHKLNHLLFTFAFWLMALTGFAQTFPVVINSQISQPTPIYWSNYADATTSNSPIKMQIVLNDLTIANRQVRIKCYWQGNGISFMNNDFVVGAQPLYLEGGVPLQLTNVNLAPYFEFQNMVGITPNQYAQAIPEGIYSFSVEVYDVASGQKLSRKSTITAVIFQNEAPLLNLPLNNASIMQQNIQNIVFSWTPRQINVSNVEYQFDLVEIWDPYTPVQNAFAYSPPIYTTTTRATTLQYSIAEPQLIPGKRYAWRIKAKALAGAEEIGVFKNNGFSEIFAFTYEVFCTPPVQIATDGVSQDQAKVTWTGALENFDYQVKYREKNADSQWYTAVTPREFAKLVNLKPNTTYEYTVGAACDKGKYVHSSPQEFTTLAKDEIAFAGCGIKPDPKDLTNQNPLPNLLPDDVVTAGDFPIVVIKSSGSNGRFTGEGYVTLPFLEKFRTLIDAADALGGEKVNIGQFSRIRITFNNIGVNTDFKLISGEIIASYDPEWKGMADLDGIVKDVFGDAGEVVNYDIQFEIASVVKNPDGTITVTGANGASFVQEKTPNDIIFTDKKGKQFTVAANAPAGPIDSSGQVAPGGIPTPKNTNGMGSGGVVAEITSADVSVVFSKGDGKYAFNTAPTTQNGKLNKTYTSLPQKSGGTYNVPFKAISNSPFEKDVIVATVDFKNGKTKKDLVFKTQNGTAIDSAQIAWNGNVATLTLKKTLDFAKETVIATVRPKEAASNTTAPSGTGGSKYDIAGTFDLWHLTNKKVNVTLVSVNGAAIPDTAEKQLNEIYEPAGVSFTATTKKITLNNFWGNTIETGDSDLLNTYTNEQQDITKALIAALGAEYSPNTYYMLYTNEKASNGDDGFMPLKRQFGFVFNGTNRTLAHELGHGVFGLQHAFKQYDTPKGSTDLLMDYGTGEVLNHNDWEIMHAPGLQLYQYTQGSSAGALAGGYALAPDWSFVSNGDETTVAYLALAPKAFLGGLVKGNKKYKWSTNKYVCDEDATLKIETIASIADGSKIYLFFDNDKPIKQNKYLRTVYNKELKDIISAKNPDLKALSSYIDKYATPANFRQKDEKRTLYWGYVGCSNCDSDGVENGAGSGGLVVDKTAKIPADELKQLIAQVSTSNQVN
ncbi:fibronectin type III domain-containing protein, partial [Flavobacterium succinicans]|uniref:fibronectin type III domain-containing protein n=1 Tax=Flavobacterium succinicans TaxID=29536 RepID=UPI001E429062